MGDLNDGPYIKCESALVAKANKDVLHWNIQPLRIWLRKV
jgi:hypothetical protein